MNRTTLPLRLREAADLTDKAIEFMGDPEQIEEAREDVALWRAAADDIDQLVDALRRVYMWVSPAALDEDSDTASVEARRICREALGMRAEDE